MTHQVAVTVVVVDITPSLVIHVHSRPFVICVDTQVVGGTDGVRLIMNVAWLIAGEGSGGRQLGREW